MNNKPSILSIATGLLIAASCSFVTTASAFAAGIEIELVNNTKWDIHELYFAPTKEDDWGPDQLKDETIPSETKFTLKDIPAGKYDIKIVDEDGDACTISDVKLAASESVTLTDQMLIGCQSNTEQDKDEE